MIISSVGHLTYELMQKGNCMYTLRKVAPSFNLHLQGNNFKYFKNMEKSFFVLLMFKANQYFLSLNTVHFLF